MDFSFSERFPGSVGERCACPGLCLVEAGTDAAKLFGIAYRASSKTRGEELAVNIFGFYEICERSTLQIHQQGAPSAEDRKTSRLSAQISREPAVLGDFVNNVAEASPLIRRYQIVRDGVDECFIMRNSGEAIYIVHKKR
jgi:hypothetical protein